MNINNPCIDLIYDIETYPNFFLFGVMFQDDTVEQFEISPWVNDLDRLLNELNEMKESRARLVGYNNLFYDYPLTHFLMMNKWDRRVSAYKILAKKSNEIIQSGKNINSKYDHSIKPSEWLIPQLDLFKIHHFDNANRSTSLKMLEFNMRSDTIAELPFDPTKPITKEQAAVLRSYNNHDLVETKKFYNESKEKIKLREELSELFGKDFTNHNDTKIGKDYFIMKLEEQQKGCCFVYDPSKNSYEPRQTKRPTIKLADCILPKIRLESKEFSGVKDFFITQTISSTSGVFKELSVEFNGVNFVFGLGGLHASIENSVVVTDNNNIVVDFDVKAFYPSVAIENNIYPEHLGVGFCSVYRNIRDQRNDFAKGTAMNALLKLANNGVYGDTNNKYSPFYDPMATMKITLNGQLFLCMLIEQVSKVQGLQLIQANTDGITVKCPKVSFNKLIEITRSWEHLTGFVLEQSIYSEMFIRDVNNYIAVYQKDNSVKRKGVYKYLKSEMDWNQNFSYLVIPKAAEQVLLHGVPASVAVMGNMDKFDFMSRTKTPRAAQLFFDKDGAREPTQRITRYYVSTDGGQLIKVTPPVNNIKVGTWKRKSKISDEFYQSTIDKLKGTGDVATWDVNSVPWCDLIHTKNKSIYNLTEATAEAGWLITTCNNANDFSFDNVNFEYYIKEVKKITDIFKK